MAVYLGFKAFSLYTTSLFFREVQIIGEQNVPDSGPCIVYGNHNNQFVDGLLLTAEINRHICFVAAAVSMRRPVVGALLRGSKAIPVERPNDIAYRGPGKIILMEGNLIKGKDTEFTKLQIKCQLKINKQFFNIIQIISDTQVRTNSSQILQINEEVDYKIVPKLEQQEVYKHVWEALNQDECIGIFPEGGSHDRLELMPFKAGICIMALGAMEKYGKAVTLVPAGFNYYNPQKFRSKVIIEFGTPFKITEQLVAIYKKDHKAAISTLLQTLQNMLKSVKVECKTFNQLSTLFLCRQLYTYKAKKNLTIKQKLELNKRFAKGFDKLAKQPEFQQVHNKLIDFNIFVKANGLSIKKKRQNNIVFDIFIFVFYFLRLVLRMAMALPGLVLMGPTTALISYQTEKQRQKCIKGEDFETQGIDIVGSYKILLSMIYFPITMIIHTILYFLLLKSYTSLSTISCMKWSLFVPLLMPFYSWIFVKSYDSLGRSFTKLKLLFVRIFKRSIYKQFGQKKKQLRKQICEMVDKYGGNVVDNFDKTRILQPEQQENSQLIIQSRNEKKKKRQ